MKPAGYQTKSNVGWLTVAIALACALTALHGCGGYGHMNGDKVAKLVEADLVRLGYCESPLECTKKQIVTAGMGIDSLHLSINSMLPREHVAEIVSHIIRDAEPGLIQIVIAAPDGRKLYVIELDERGSK